MGKVITINKSRKATKCKKCGAEIPVGSKYYKGEIAFSSTIIRCEKCGLKPYEVTTSSYLQSVGRLVEDWREDYSISEDGLCEMISIIQGIYDECEASLDNLPDQLKDAPTGELLQERLDGLDAAMSELDIDISALKEEAVNSCTDIAEYLEDENSEDAISSDYDDLVNCKDIESEWIDTLVEEFESLLGEAIDDALSNIVQ